MKTAIRALALILLLALLALPLSACSAVDHPLRYLKNATLKTLQESTLGQIISVIRESTSDGAISGSFAGAGEENGFSSGSLTVYFTPDADRIVAAGNMTLGEKTYDAEFFLDEKAIVFRSGAFLGSSTLGITLDTLQKDIASSIFRNNSGTAYADAGVDDATAGEIKAFVESLLALYDDLEDMGELAEDAADTFLAKLEEYANTSYYRQSGKMYVTVKVENGALSKALRETRKELVSSRKFCKNLREWAGEYDAMLSATSGVVTNKYTQKVEDFLTNDAGTEAVCTAIDLMPPFVLTLDATVRILSRTAEKLSLTKSVAGVVTRAIAFDRTEENAVIFSLTGLSGTREIALRNISSTRKEFRADLSFSLKTLFGESDICAGTVVWDKKNETYTLALTRGEEARTISGAFALSHKHWRWSVDRVQVGDIALDHSFSLEATVGAEAPETPEYTNLFTIDSNRFKLTDSILTPAREAFEADMERLAPSARKTLSYFYDVLGLNGILPLPTEEEP